MTNIAKLPVNDQADGRSREIVREALATDWDIEAAKASLRVDDHLPSVIARYEISLKPLTEQDEGTRKANAVRIDELLRPIGAKIAPHLSGEQATAWRGAMVLALSNLAPRVAIDALRATIHVPLSFLSDVEKEVRAAAAIADAKFRVALSRLRRMQREIEQASQPKLTSVPVEPMTADEIAAANVSFKKIGSRVRFGADGEVYSLEPGDFDPVSAPVEETRS